MGGEGGQMHDEAWLVFHHQRNISFSWSGGNRDHGQRVDDGQMKIPLFPAARFLAEVATDVILRLLSNGEMLRETGITISNGAREENLTTSQVKT